MWVILQKSILINRLWGNVRIICQSIFGHALIEADDTAEAARRLSEGKLPATSGVVGSDYCAELYDLNIVQEGIHDLKNNITLFLGVEKMDNDKWKQ